MFGARQDHVLLLLLALEAPSALGMPQKFVKVGDMSLTAQQVPKTLWPEFGFQEGSVPNEEEVAKSPGQRDEMFRWPGGVLNYDLSNVISSEHRALVRSTLANLETKLDSCIKFREVNSGFRVIVGEGGGCGSAVGYNGYDGGQASQGMDLTSKEGCMTPSVIEHEFLHALGVFHTQQRTDRDRYIKINVENIIQEFKSAFSKLSETEVDEFGLPYDFCSVMHYADWAFSKDKKIPTIETLDPSKQDIIGKAKGVSEGDIMLLRRMYKCGPQPPTTASRAPG